MTDSAKLIDPPKIDDAPLMPDVTTDGADDVVVVAQDGNPKDAGKAKLDDQPNDQPESTINIDPKIGIGSGAGAQNNANHTNAISADDPAAINNNLAALADGSILLRH